MKENQLELLVINQHECKYAVRLDVKACEACMMHGSLPIKPTGCNGWSQILRQLIKQVLNLSSIKKSYFLSLFRDH